MNLLNGIKILDFTRLLPGPLATHLLAGLGAEVIKVESPKRRDYVREQPPLIKGRSTLFEALNHRKHQALIDYQSPEGRVELTALIRESDVLIEQFRPGVMEKLGWGYNVVKSINPRIIYVSLSGYGQSGPLSASAGHDLNYLAHSGLLDLNRDRAGRPVIPGLQIADIGSGAYLTVSSVMAGLLGRERQGGMHIDVSMLDGLLPLLTFPLSQHWGGWPPKQLKILHGGLVNYDVYECADGEWVALGALEMKFWNRFCEILERPQWQRTQQLELSAHIFPKGEIQALFKTKTRDEWVAFVGDEDVCLSPVVRLEELGDQAQTRARGLFESFETKDGTMMNSLRVPIRIVDEGT
jgi:crotonobetainyl-CoA:carnitine CoA-transferase CaiB-like acyl-CoA transferase